MTRISWEMITTYVLSFVGILAAVSAVVCLLGCSGAALLRRSRARRRLPDGWWERFERDLRLYEHARSRAQNRTRRGR